ncbi:MAG: hypothetical protein Kow0047_18250 [Anaerolineae bacterium]
MRRRALPGTVSGATLAVIILLCALLPRLLDRSPFITWDELAWVYRSAHFLDALADGRWEKTYLTGHPGVTTMWSGALGLAVGRLNSSAVAEGARQVAAAKAMHAHDVALLRALGPLLPTAQWPLATAVSLAIAGVFAILAQTIGVRAAAVGSLLLALSPFYIAHSRVLHTDALTATWALLAIVAAHASREGPRPLAWAALSGACAALAALSKTPGALVSIVALGTIITATKTRNRAIRAAVIWGVAAIATGFILWPALWAAPVQTLRDVILTALGYAERPHESGFFLGEAGGEYDWRFYPLVVALRSTPITLSGLIALGLGWRWTRPEERSLAKALLTWALFYLAAMTLTAKKFDRYALPALIGLDLMAGLGWATLARQARHALHTRGRAVAMATVAIAVTGQGLCAWPMHPYYISFYNPLAGGAAVAVRTIPVGWGEGIEQAADYLNRLPDAEEKEVAAWAVVGLAPRFHGRVRTLSEQSLLTADYAVLYIGDVQFRSPHYDRFYGAKEPIYTVREHGITYAWVYANDAYQPYLAELLVHIGRDDYVVFGEPSQLSAHWPDDRPKIVLSNESDARALSQIPGAARVWYVDHEPDDPDEPDPIRLRLEVSGAQMDHVTLGPIAVTGFQIQPEGMADETVLRALDVAFGGQIALTRLELSGEEIAPGQALHVNLWWRAQGQPDADYTAFVHLVNDRGERVAQMDRRLADAAGRGSSAWQPGDQAVTSQVLRIEEDTPPGTYRLLVGLYRLDTDERLIVQGGELDQNDTAAVLARIVIRPAVTPPAP